MSAFVYSTLAADVDYARYKPGGGDLQVIDRKVRVNGGAGVIKKNLITPLGVVTEVSDEDVKLLEAHPVFKLHRDNGHVSIVAKKVKIDKAVADMTPRDKSAQKRLEDFKRPAKDGTNEPTDFNV